MAGYLASIVASTLNNTRKEVFGQIWGSHPIWYKLDKQKSPVDGGLNIVETLEISKNPTVAFRHPKASIPLQETDDLMNVGWAWKSLSGSVVVYDDDERVNRGKWAIRNYTEAKINNFKKTMADVLAAGLYASGGDNALDGLPVICSTSNTYPVADSAQQVAGLARTTYSWWQAIVKSTTEAWSLTGGTDGGWQKAYDDAINYGQGAGVGLMNDEPDIIVTSQALFEKYEQSLLDNQRYQDKDLGEAGFRSLMYRGAAVVWDPNIDAATSTYMLNTKYLKLRPDSQCANDFNYEPMHRMEADRASRMLASWDGNITCVMPRKQVLISNKS